MWVPGAESPIPRPCDLCFREDRGLRNAVELGGGRVALYHLPYDLRCGVPGANPYPGLDQPVLISQEVAALTQDPLAQTPDLTQPRIQPTIVASDPAAKVQVLVSTFSEV